MSALHVVGVRTSTTNEDFFSSVLSEEDVFVQMGWIGHGFIVSSWMTTVMDAGKHVVFASSHEACKFRVVMVVRRNETDNDVFIIARPGHFAWKEYSPVQIEVKQGFGKSPEKDDDHISQLFVLGKVKNPSPNQMNLMEREASRAIEYRQQREAARNRARRRTELLIAHREDPVFVGNALKSLRSRAEKAKLLVLGACMTGPMSEDDRLAWGSLDPSYLGVSLGEPLYHAAFGENAADWNNMDRFMEVLRLTIGLRKFNVIVVDHGTFHHMRRPEVLVRIAKAFLAGTLCVPGTFVAGLHGGIEYRLDAPSGDPAYLASLGLLAVKRVMLELRPGSSTPTLLFRNAVTEPTAAEMKNMSAMRELLVPGKEYDSYYISRMFPPYRIKCSNDGARLVQYEIVT